MHLKNIYLRQFRNISNQKLNFSPKMNLFYGNNGQGKTNLIEAIQFLVQGNSFREGKYQNCVNENHDEAFLKTQIEKSKLCYDVETLLKKDRKTHTLNEKQALASKISTEFSTICFSPESLSAIKEGSENRRKLVDEQLFIQKKSNLDLVRDFNKCLKTRNKILKTVFLEKENTPKQNFCDNQNLLESINPIFLKLSAELAFQRICALREIQDLHSDILSFISNKNYKKISYEYLISKKNNYEMSHFEIYDFLKKRLSELESAEKKIGMSLVGPQRHDINFLLDNKESRYFCSQGQQRSIILSFKMAQIVYHRRVHGFYPVLMLDDVFSEIDLEKQKALMDFLNESNAQIFITSTETHFLSNIKKNDISVKKVTRGLVEDCMI